MGTKYKHNNKVTNTADQKQHLAGRDNDDNDDDEHYITTRSAVAEIPRDALCH